MFLAFKFDFIDEFIKKLISRANHKTSEVNILLEYIEFLSDPKKIIEQYEPGVQIGEITQNLQIAFTKLDLYMNLIQSAVRVSGVHNHLQFEEMEVTEGSGFTGNYAAKCSYCGKELIEYDQLMQFNKDLAN